jgi:hypothetical protein
MIGKTARTWVVTGALALGAVAGAAGVANAASGGTTHSPSQPAPPSPAQDPATTSHGLGETGLTGAAASKARAAALAAVPGAMVIRVETDSAGAAYEAHLRKSDGSYVTVKLDKAFNVTGTQSGFGGPAQ